MKEIKLRAWDKVTKIMAEVIGLKTGLTDDSIKIWYINKDGEEMFCNPQKADIVLMQYTGLKDKNGVEICEGDIAKREIYEDVWVVGEVEWIDEGFCGFFLKVIKEDLNRTSRHYAIGKGEYSDSDRTNYEVIGNIHNNPELLEGRE